jgi:hypothetical protein
MPKAILPPKTNLLSIVAGANLSTNAEALAPTITPTIPITSTAPIPEDFRRLDGNLFLLAFFFIFLFI